MVMTIVALIAVGCAFMFVTRIYSSKDAYEAINVADASAVTKYFNNVGNIDYKRLTAVGYGEYQPLLGETSSFNTMANNRINIIIFYN